VTAGTHSCWRAAYHSKQHTNRNIEYIAEASPHSVLVDCLRSLNAGHTPQPAWACDMCAASQHGQLESEPICFYLLSIRHHRGLIFPGSSAGGLRNSAPNCNISQAWRPWKACWPHQSFGQSRSLPRILGRLLAAVSAREWCCAFLHGSARFLLMRVRHVYC